MKELKEQAGEQIITELKNYGVDLALLQTEQRYMHRQHRRKNNKHITKKSDGAALKHQ